MIKKGTYLLISFVLWNSIHSTSLYAAAGMHEMSFGSGTLALSGGISALDLGVGYHFGVTEWLQAGVQGSFLTATFQDTTVTIITAIFGPLINIGPSDSAFFIGGGFAIKSGSPSDTTSSTSSSTSTSDSSSDSTSTTTSSSTSTSPGGAGYGIIFGKRFPLVEGFSFRPNIGFLNAGQASFLINPFQFSIQF